MTEEQRKRYSAKSNEWKKQNTKQLTIQLNVLYDKDNPRTEITITELKEGEDAQE